MLKAERLNKNIKRWSAYQEFLGEEIFTPHKKWGRTRKTKGLRVVVLEIKSVHVSLNSDFKSQILPKAFGRRRKRTNLVPNQADWQYELRSINTPP